MTISTLGAAHVAAALTALAFGALVLALRKGTQLHRAMGMVYAIAMVALNLTALTVYRINGHFGPFHVLALLSLATIVAGLAMVVLRPHNWLVRHYRMMNFSYLGLLSAATTQALVKVPLLHGAMAGTITGIVSAVAFIVLGVIILPRLQQRAVGSVAVD